MNSPDPMIVLVGLMAGALLALGLLIGLRRRAGMGDHGCGSAVESALASRGETILLLDPDRPARVIAGLDVTASLAEALGASDAPGLVAALGAGDRAVAEAVAALTAQGVPFTAQVSLAGGALALRGWSAGALAFLSVSDSPPDSRMESADRPGDLRALIDAHPFPALAIDADGRPTTANQAWLDSLGAASLTEALARGEIADRGAVALAREAQAAGAPRERVRWQGPSAARRALRLRASPLPDGGAAVWSWDVTDAEGAAEAAARDVAAQALIFAQVADAVAIFGPDQRLRLHNPAFARLWGLEPAWLADGPTHGTVLDRLRQAGRLPEAADYAKFKAAELARHDRLDPAPETIWRIGGERLLRVSSLPHPGGGLVRVFSDITPEVRLKSQFTQLLQVQQATLDKLTDAVAVFGADGRLRLHNEAFQSLWGVQPEMLAGTPTFDAVVERCVPILHDMHFWGALKGRITDPDPGVRAAVRGEARAADGRRLAWQSRPLPDGATLVSFADVTDTRRLEGALSDREAALDTAERLKRQFVSSVSYELRTPLTTILGYAELLELGEAALSEKGRGWVAAVRSAAADLARSVEDILAFAELDAGEMALDLAETDVGDLLTGAAADWRERADAAGVGLRIEAGEEPGVLLADAPSLIRVLDHLIEHALRQTPAGGRITLSARRAPGEVCLEVADTGRGIPFHVQAHIFDRFSGEEGAAAGLGLALVKALVELHGGWVALESEPGAGAAFACHLPVGGQVPDESMVLL